MTAFHGIEAATPSLEKVQAEYATLGTAFEKATTPEEHAEAIRQWDEVRSRIGTWSSLVHLRFNQETANEEYRKARDHCDELAPQLTELEVDLKRKLLTDRHRPAIEAHFGKQAPVLWESEISTFDPALEESLVKEAKVGAEYTELLAKAELEYGGETLNLSELERFSEDPDRQVRYETRKLRWDYFGRHADELDRIFDDLVRLRTDMARQLGFPSFVEMGYQRMCRVDYNRQDVERFRDEVRTHVVPLAAEITRKQAERLGVDPIMAWDESLHDPAGNPAPVVDSGVMLDRAQEMFAALDPRLSEFFTLMQERDLLDLETRHGKAGGGFCTAFPSHGLPFIFANFNRTKGDVEVFTHEVGHAFQFWCSREQSIYDYYWPTYESCEIHSMSLEFLTWPQMELFFGDDAERFRAIHLAESLLFLPYGVAVDHFQHQVYENPDASPGDRHAMWQEIEKMYLPWRKYGDLEHPARGGRWQAQRHIYLAPFYYIDYTLALTCALQFWVRGEKNPQEAMESYVKLCQRGGEAPFQELARSADLVSPFQNGCLEEVVRMASSRLS